MKEKLEAFLRDLQDVCIKHGATIIPTDDGIVAGCRVEFEGIDEEVQLGECDEAEAWAWPKSWTKPLTVTR